jgi:hypothetical protein
MEICRLKTEQVANYFSGTAARTHTIVYFWVDFNIFLINQAATERIQ